MTTNFNLKLFVQGYYNGNGTMKSVAFNQDDKRPTNEVEPIQVCLYDENGLVEQSAGMLQTDGTLSVEFSNEGSYWLSVAGVNSLQLFATPKFNLDGVDIEYDFTLQTENTAEVESGVYAMYSGDINRDGVIDSTDETLLQNAINSSLSGVQDEDLNGDGAVDNSDYDFLNLGKSVAYPIGLPKPR